APQGRHIVAAQACKGTQHDILDLHPNQWKSLQTRDVAAPDPGPPPARGESKGNIAIRNPQSAIRNPKSEIRNPKSEIRNPKSEIRNRHTVPLSHAHASSCISALKQCGTS